MEKLKKLLSKLPEVSPAQGWLMVIAGGYLIYMAFQMLRDTRSDVSSMSMPVTVLLMILMSLCGIAARP